MKSKMEYVRIKVPYLKGKRIWQHISVILLCLLLWSNNPFESNVQAVKTKVTVKENKIEIEDKKPNIKYISPKKIKKQLKETDSIKVKDYKFNIDTTYTSNNSKVKFKAIGWGDIKNIKIEAITKDSLIEKTIYKASNGLFLSGEYITPILRDSGLKDIYKVNLDYQIRNKVIIGTSVGIMNKEPLVGVKFGIKL